MGSNNQRCLYSISKGGSSIRWTYLETENLYKLTDAACNFFESVKDVSINLDCYQSKLNSVLFIFKHDDILSGTFACHVDDFLHTQATHPLKNDTLTLLTEKIIAGKYDSFFSYISFQIMKDNQGITLSINPCMLKILIRSV